MKKKKKKKKEKVVVDIIDEMKIIKKYAYRLIYIDKLSDKDVMQKVRIKFDEIANHSCSKKRRMLKKEYQFFNLDFAQKWHVKYLQNKINNSVITYDSKQKADEHYDKTHKDVVVKEKPKRHRILKPRVYIIPAGGANKWRRRTRHP